MNGGQAAVGLGAIGLVIANQVTHRPLALSSVISNTKTVTPASQSQWSEILFEVIGAIVLTVIAGIGTYGAKIAGVIVVLLWVLFLITYESSKKSPAKTAPKSVKSKAA